VTYNVLGASVVTATANQFGAAIYRGAHDEGGSGGAPTFSVSLTPVKGWSIHT
jgi:hypothetical protein